LAFVTGQVLAPWMEENKQRRAYVRLFTNDQISKLGSAAMKNFEGEALTRTEITAKHEISEGISNALSDINQIVRLEMFDPMTEWRPVKYDRPRQHMVFSTATVANTFRLNDLLPLVRVLVKVFGEYYAIPLANAIRLGLQDGEASFSNLEVDVPIIKRVGRSL